MNNALNELSEKEKIIQEHAKLIEENEREGITDALSDAEMLKRMEETEAVSTTAMNQLSEKEKIFEEQAKI